MAQIHGKNCSITLVNAAGTTVNVSGDGNNCLLTESINNPEVTGFGDNNVQRSGSGLGDAKFQYEGWAGDDSASGNLAVFSGSGIKGYISLIIFGPAGSAAGAVKYSACMLLDSGEVRAPTAGLVTARATLSLASGSITKGVF